MVEDRLLGGITYPINADQLPGQNRDCPLADAAAVETPQTEGHQTSAHKAERGGITVSKDKIIQGNQEDRQEGRYQTHGKKAGVDPLVAEAGHPDVEGGVLPREIKQLPIPMMGQVDGETRVEA